jgi:hypothetical protein
MMPEQHSAEVEKALLSIGDARDCTEAAGERLARAGAEGQVIDALRDAERDLTELHTRLTKRTYYASAAV